jgi:hypothetical protein
LPFELHDDTEILKRMGLMYQHSLSNQNPSNDVEGAEDIVNS